MNTTTTTTEEIPLQPSTDDEWLVPYLFFLLVMGTIGNTCGVLIFLNSSMRKYSCSLYFLLMSIFDEIYLFFWITNRLSQYLTDEQLRNRSTFICKVFVLTTYCSAQAAIGMLVLATFDRLYTTVKIARGHFDVRLVHHRRRFQNISLCIFFLTMIGFDAPLFGAQLVSPDDDGSYYCIIVNFEITRIYSIIDLCLYAIIPRTFMLIADILILYHIRKSRARVISIHDDKKRRERQLSIMLAVTSIISLIIVSPYSVLTVLNNFIDLPDDSYGTLYILNNIFGLLSTFTHAMHFYLFLIISSTIRQHFKVVLKSFVFICSKKRNAIRPATIPVKETRTTTFQRAFNILPSLPAFPSTKQFP